MTAGIGMLLILVGMIATVNAKIAAMCVVAIGLFVVVVKA